MLFSRAVLLFALFVVASCSTCVENFPFLVPLVDFPPCFNAAQQAGIFSSTDMPPTVGQIVVSIPFNVIVDFIFNYTYYWPTWNSFVTYADPNPVLCSSWSTTVTNTPLMKSVPATANGFPPVIVVNSVNESFAALGWSYLTNDKITGETYIFGRHDYYFHNLSNGRTAVGSWEKATGPLVSQNSNAWVAGLGEAMFDTMIGVTCLEMVYQQYGFLDVPTVNMSCSYLQYSRPNIGPVPVPAGYAENLIARATANLNLTPSPAPSPSSTPAILAGVLGGLFGVLLGAVVTYFFLRSRGAHGGSGGGAEPYVSMK